MDEALVVGRHRLSMAEAETLRFEKKPLEFDTVFSIVEDRKRTARKPSALVLEPILLSRYFKPEQEKEEIEMAITKALDQYFKTPDKPGSPSSAPTF